MILGTGYLTRYLLHGLDLPWSRLALWLLLAMTAPTIGFLLFLVPRTSELDDTTGWKLVGREVGRLLAILLAGAFLARLFQGEVHQFIATVVALQMLSISDRIFFYVHENI